MRLSACLAAVAAISSLELVSAYPGMGNMMSEVKHIAAKTKRHLDGGDEPPAEMIGDLINGATTPVGTLIQQCLLGQIDCYDDSPKVCICLRPVRLQLC